MTRLRQPLTQIRHAGFCLGRCWQFSTQQGEQGRSHDAQLLLPSPRSLPSTIIDTMDILRQLGEQYVCANALFLIKDDPVDLYLRVITMDLL